MVHSLYRAAYYAAADGQETVLTSCPDPVDWASDDQLVEAAVREAYRRGMIGDALGMSEAELRDGLCVGTWAEQAGRSMGVVEFLERLGARDDSDLVS